MLYYEVQFLRPFDLKDERGAVRYLGPTEQTGTAAHRHPRLGGRLLRVSFEELDEKASKDEKEVCEAVLPSQRASATRGRIKYKV